MVVELDKLAVPYFDSVLSDEAVFILIDFAPKESRLCQCYQFTQC